MIKIVSAAIDALSRQKSKPDRPAQHVKLQRHEAVMTTPGAVYEVGEKLVKENWVIRNGEDPDHFNHYLAHIYHPHRQNPALPVLVALPGMLCNGNLFRLVPHDGNFRNLDTGESFANALASKGFHVVLANPRYSRWIYTRYVEGRLGVRNYFSDAIDFERLVDDLAFYVDASVHLSGTKSAAVLGFSMGGMELMYYLATRGADPLVSHAVFLGAPAEFSSRQTIITLLYIYNFLAKFAPIRRYAALELLARNVVPLKHILRKLPPKAIAGIPLGRELFNPEQVDPREIIPFISYVLEPMPTPVIDYLIWTAARKQLLSQDKKVDILPRLSGCDIPSLVVSGDRDGLVSINSDRKLFEALGGGRKRMQIIREAGHLDLIAGLKCRETVEAVAGFLLSYSHA
jgi:pimeloyl-ACP methyl ester carboxylesterase